MERHTVEERKRETDLEKRETEEGETVNEKREERERETLLRESQRGRGKS